MPRSMTFSPSLRFGTIFHCLHQRNSCTCMSGTRKERSCRSRPCMSVLGGWSQPVDATLYLMERWSVLWVEDFIEGLLRQRRRSYGIAGSEGESLKAIGRAFGKPSSSIYFLVAPHGGIRPAERRRSRLALTLAEREVSSRGVTADQSARSIARLLGRSSRPNCSHN